MDLPIMQCQEMVHIEIEKIKANPHQPRKHFCPEELEGLAWSILHVGIIQPPVVQPMGDGVNFVLISGERRLRAAELAGLKTIPVIVKDEGEISTEAALVENIQRVDLNPLEIAQALDHLITESGYRQEEIADRIGKPRSTITNYLRLLSLPNEIQSSLDRKKITMGHAKAILSVNGFEKQLLLHQKILDEDLSVRESEQAAKKIDKLQKMKRIVNRDCHIQELEEKIQGVLGTKVSIRGNEKRGRITIDYYNLDDLDRILQVFI